MIDDATSRRSLERIALISDVHGNLTALEAVLEDIDARGISRIFNLGDYVGKGPRGREVIDLCRERCQANIIGNRDHFLPNPDREFDSNALAWWLAQLSDGQGGGSGCSTRRRQRCTGGFDSITMRRSSSGCLPTPRQPETARNRRWSGTAI